MLNTNKLSWYGDLKLAPTPPEPNPLAEKFKRMLCPVRTATKAPDGVIMNTQAKAATTYSDTDTWTTTWKKGQVGATAVYTTTDYGQ